MYFLIDGWTVSAEVYGLFFFKQRTAYEMRISDWSSDVCSSDLDPRSALHRLGDVALARDAIAVVFQRRLERRVDAIARNRRAYGLEHRREAVEHAVRRPPVARDRRDPRSEERSVGKE